MRKIWAILIFSFMALAGCAVWQACCAQSTTPDAAPFPSLVSTTATTSITPDDRIYGKPDAPITIIEYASLTCPHCADFEANTLPQIEKNWIDTGKAKLVFRDFPFDGVGLRAAMLARCAPPDKFMGFVKTLFGTQRSWAHSDDNKAALKRIAKLGGMTDEQFDTCMDDKTLETKVVAERQGAEKDLKVDSTPTFFINGQKLVGAQPYDKFDAALQQASSKS
jgi:protein-disulfide isomerase